jgi:hypothetical protein
MSIIIMIKFCQNNISMTDKVFYILFFFLLGSCGNAENVKHPEVIASVKNNEVELLEVSDLKIQGILDTTKKQIENHYRMEDRVYIMRCENINNSFEIRLSTFNEGSLSDYLRDKKDKLAGYFYNGDNVVLVFGEYSPIFKKSAKFKEFGFLKSIQKKLYKEGEIPPPPVNYEPIVLIYRYEGGQFTLEEQGIVSLLK